MPSHRTAAWIAALAWLLLATAQAQGLPALETSAWPAELAAPTPEQLASGVADPNFVVQQPPVRRLGPDPGTVRWWRVRITEPWVDPSHPVLALYAPYTNTVQVMIPPDYRLRRMSLRSPDFDATHSRHALVLELPDDWDPTQPVYIGVEPGQRLPMRMELVTNKAFEVADIGHLQLVWSLFAAIAMVMVVVAVFGVVLRARQLLYLAASIAGMLVFQGLVLGEFYSLPGAHVLAAAGYRPIWSARALQEAFLLLFAVEFLGGTARLPRLGRMLGLLARAFLLLAVVAWLPLPELAGRALASSGSVLFSLATLLLLLALALRVRAGQAQAWFFVIAWVPMMILDGLRELELLRLVALYPDDEYLPLYASAWTALVLAIGVARRMHAVLDERDSAVVAAELDPLTGVFNHRAVLDRLQAAGPDTGNGLSVLYLDLDHFKLVNDRFGHAVGDACLTAAVNVMRRELRAGDSLGRLGGEEFLAVLPGTGLDQALRIGERIRAGIQGMGGKIGGHEIRLTISIGVASAVTAARCADLVDRADQGMYRAKADGRNCVRVAPPGI